MNMTCPNCQSGSLSPERSSGYDGYRCSKCGNWIYNTGLSHSNEALNPEMGKIVERLTQAVRSTISENLRFGGGDMFEVSSDGPGQLKVFMTDLSTNEVHVMRANFSYIQMGRGGLKECIARGTHLTDADNDGYCNYCGHNDPIEFDVVG